MTEDSSPKFSEGFLDRFPTFRGELERSDRMLGEQWLRVWQAAKEEAAACVRANAHLFSTPEACELLALEIIKKL